MTQQIIQTAINKAIKNKDTKFLCKILFDEEITPLQELLIRKVAFCLQLNIKRLSVSAMTRWGKSYCVSRGIALFLMMEKNKKVFFIGPKTEQALILRDYMTELVFKCPALFNLTDLEKGKDEKAKKESSRKRVTMSKMDNEYRVFSAEGDANRLMGHGLGDGGGILVLDEATLIRNDVRAKISRMMGDNPDKAVILELFNPWTRDSKAFEHTQDPNWEYIHIGYEEAIRDGRITKEFIEEQRKEMTDLEFTVLYESKFPQESEDQLIPYWAIHDSIREMPKDFKPNKTRVGVDPAEKGKDLTVRIRIEIHGGLRVVTDVKVKSKDEPAETITDIQKDYKNKSFDDLIIDSVGIGSGVYSGCKKLNREGIIKTNVKEFKAGKSPTNLKAKKEFRNLKSQAGFFMRDLFTQGNIIIPPKIAKEHPQLIKELNAMKWEIIYSSNLKHVVDPGKLKDDPSELKSPDYYDALTMACFEFSGVCTI